MFDSKTNDIRTPFSLMYVMKTTSFNFMAGILGREKQRSSANIFLEFH